MHVFKVLRCGVTWGECIRGRHRQRNLVAFFSTAAFLIVLQGLHVFRPYKIPGNSRPECCDILITHQHASFYAQLPVELKQFRRAVKMNRSFIARSERSPGRRKLPPGYSYTFELACNSKKTRCGFVMLLNERLNGTLTSGGSSFRILLGSSPRLICSFDDYLNGTYIVFCPEPVYQCNVVTVAILYVNYDAYIGNVVPVNKVLWSKSVCPLDDGRCSVASSKRVELVERTSLPNVSALSSRVTKQNRFYWRPVSGGLRMFDRGVKEGVVSNGTVVQNMSTLELCRCLGRFKNLVMIGPSHMRYKFHHFIGTCHTNLTMPPKKHETLQFMNFRFIFKTYMKQLDGMWMNEIRPFNLTSHDAVMLQIGSWDMSHFRLDKVIGGLATDFKVALTELRDGLRESGTPFFLITEPPFPDRQAWLESRGNRNNVAIATLSTLFVSMAIELGIPIYDEFNILLPRQEETVCWGHYICNEAEHSRTIIGNAGKESLMMFAKCLCDR